MKGSKHMFDSIRGVITFSVCCAEPDKFINVLKNSYIVSRNLRIINSSIMGEVYTSDYETLKEFAEKNSAELKELKRRGIIFVFRKYKKRVGLFVGFFLALALVIFFSNIVMTIEISGNERVTDEQILAILEDNGIKIGSFIPNIDFRRAERKIIVALDDLAWIGVRNTGCRVIVEVNERTNTPEMIPTTRPCNVVSTKDAQIVGLKVYMGMLIPMMGDGVRKGDLLISGVVEGNHKNTYYVHAMGDIIGRYEEKVSFSQNMTNNITVYDDEIVKKSISVFGFRIPLYINKSVDCEYEYSEQINNFKLLKLTLPVGIVISEYNPYTIESISYTEEDAEAILNEKVSRYEQNFLNDGSVKIIDSKRQITLKDNVMTVTVIYTLEGNIGETQEILAKY
jgi:similar to stage IV sporulation protein